jgi:hypothetical protein
MDGATYFASAVSYASKNFMELTTGYIRPSSNPAQIGVTVFTKIIKHVVGNNKKAPWANVIKLFTMVIYCHSLVFLSVDVNITILPRYIYSIECQYSLNGATTSSIMAPSMTFSIMDLIVTLSIPTLSIKGLFATVSINYFQHDNTLQLCCMSFCCVSLSINSYVNVIMLNLLMPNVIKLSVIMLNVIMLEVIMLNVIILSVIS